MKVPSLSFENSNSEGAPTPMRQDPDNLPADEGSAFPNTPSLNNSSVPNTTIGQDSENVDVTGSDNPFTSADTSAEVQDTTTFVSYGKKTVKVFDRTLEQTQVVDMLRPLSEAKHTIETFLSRPVKIAEGILPTDINKPFATVDILPTISKMKIWTDKLSGLYGFRAKANYKLVTNAQPFEMGLINISFFPFVRLRNDFNSTNNHSQSLTFLTSLPNVVMNISTQSEVVLSVDYTGPNAYINLSNPHMQWGQFVATTLTRVKNLDNNNCKVPYSVYLYLTDIEYFGATPANSVSFQMDPAGFSRRKQRREAIQVNSGNVASSLIDAASHVIPILAGLSKPPQDQRVVRQHLQPFGNPQLFDSTSNAIKLSAQNDQATDIAPLGVTPEDEMDITNIVSKPTYYGNILWKTTDTIGTNLFYTPVEPNVPLDGTVKFSSTRSYVPNRVQGVANMFDYWRGSLIYTFHIAATNFHSGRISLIFAPGADSVYSTVYENKHNSYYAVWDLRKGATFQIACPFISTTAWRSVPKYYRLGGDSVAGYMFDSRPAKSGNFVDSRNWFYMYVETPLQTPSGTGEIDIACFVSAGPDFQVAAPAALRNIPIMYEAKGDDVPHSQPPSKKNLEDENKVTFQSENDVPRLLITAGQQHEPTRKSLATSVTMGEEIRSLRAVIKRYQLISAGTIDPNNIISIAPWAFRGGRIPAGGSAVKVLPTDHFSLIRMCYAFYRGGMRYLIHTESGASKFLQLTYRTELLHDTYDKEGKNTYTYNYKTDLNGPLGANLVYGQVQWKEGALSSQAPMIQQGFPSVAVLPIVQTVTGGIEVEVPYYTKVHKSLVYNYDDQDMHNVSIDENNFLQPSGFISIRNEGEQVQVRISRAAADDFNLGYFLGFPVHIANVTSYWSIGQQKYSS